MYIDNELELEAVAESRERAELRAAERGIQRFNVATNKKKHKTTVLVDSEAYCFISSPFFYSCNRLLNN